MEAETVGANCADQLANVDVETAGAQKDEATKPPDDEGLTNEERWNLVWACVGVYYTYDAAIGLAVALLAFLGGLIFKAVIKSDCESKVWIVSLVILAVRTVDMCCGIASLRKNPIPSRSSFFRHIVENMLICTALGILALVQVIMSGILFTKDDCLWSAIIGLVSGLLLIMQSAEEMTIWTMVMGLWFACGSSQCPPLPNWVDPLIPKWMMEKAKAHRVK
eukprot:TRINITY_DN94092_c0_g1_i1.p1 TRINITY_DN94092_c0_g1~~TRINITY_DN94092_c0_g1_i1.p1  ORF type:complete len:242 (-),score=28.98 TRINITY_DN94092_c0_g1_i1:59-721(-)